MSPIIGDTETLSNDRFHHLAPQLDKNTAIVDNNRISQNQGCGLSFAGSEDIIIRDNVLDGNHGSGIAIDQPVEATIHSNRVLDNRGAGISLEVSSLSCLRDNCICGNLGNGVVARGRGRIRENDIINNEKSELVILGPGDPFVAKNRIVSLKATAIEVLSDARGCVNENEIYAKSGKSIVQDLSSTTIIENNEILSSFENETKDGNLATRPLQTGNSVPRPDIAHIVRKLTQTQPQKSSAKTMSRFCVVL